MRIRKSVLQQSIRIPFTHKGRQRPVKELTADLLHYLDANATESNTEQCSPDSLVGRDICHKFNVDGEEKWFNGYVISYNAVTHLHEVSYEGEQTCFFNLLEDLQSGDLIIDNN